MTAIEISNVSFTYRVLKNRSGSLKELFKDFVSRKVRVENYQALKDVSFTVDSGEVIAIIGQNGAGKSTLLKILAQVLPPTTGKAKVTGAIAPMIELGAGFHLEMSGQENVLLYSTLMGRDVNKTRKRTAAIGEWAGVTDHMDFPLRTFSSGMIARLAFATATDETVDVLLIDEVLSVGDADFQAKSSARLQELIHNGAAVVLVSHDMNAVRKLAHKAIWLENGVVKMSGPTEQVVTAYEKQ
jgi:ABC-type polysaccharide/polyol phosphate transport system ATPase subunit